MTLQKLCHHFLSLRQWDHGCKLERLKAGLKALPRTVTHLRLGGNKLGELKPEDLVDTLKNLPDTVKYLDLRNNKLNKLKTEGLTLFFRAISKVTHLDLRMNNLVQNKVDVSSSFKALQPSVIYLNLSSNFFISEDSEFADLFNRILPEHIKTVVMRDEEINVQRLLERFHLRAPKSFFGFFENDKSQVTFTFGPKL